MANYAIMRIEKRKLPSVGRINKHHERLKEEYKSNPDIDRAHHDGRHDAKLPDTLDKLLHSLIVLDLKGIVLKSHALRYLDFLNIHLSFPLS